MKLPCELIRDLLPLYHDGVCSEESRVLVEEHLAQCADCKDFLHALDEEITMGDKVDAAKPLVSIQMTWNKQKRKALIKGVSIALAICLILVVGWWSLTSWDVVTLGEGDFSVVKLAQLKNGYVQLRIADGYYGASPEIVYVAEERALYEVRKRPVLAKQRELPSEDAIPNYQGSWWQIIFDPAGEPVWTEVDGEVLPIKAFYIGEPGSEDVVLIWEEGMELPPADEETEQYWAKNQAIFEDLNN